MPRFNTCHTCMKPAATCPTRERLNTAIAGLGITSLKHRCPDYAPAFLPGDPVKVDTIAWYPQEDDRPPRCWFPGHFIRLVGQRALVFVPAKAMSLDGCEYEFEPHGNGYLKLPLSRVAHRNGEPADVIACTWCGCILGLGEACARDPHYTPASQCAAELARSEGQ